MLGQWIFGPLNWTIFKTVKKEMYLDIQTNRTHYALFKLDERKRSNVHGSHRSTEKKGPKKGLLSFW